MDYFKELGKAAYCNDPELFERFIESMSEEAKADKIYIESIETCNRLQNQLLLRQMELAKKSVL